MNNHGIPAWRWSLILLLAIVGCETGPSKQEIERKQAEELYKPLLALVKESKHSVETFLETKLKREYIHPTNGNLEGDELRMWLEQVEGDLMPRNEKMCALVRAKRNPELDGPDLSKQFQSLLDHQGAWRALHEKWKKDKVPYNWRSPSPFPRLLQRELEDKLKVPQGD
jgi:hypothetical protein